jgi:uncharacterized membrane protein
MKRVILGLIYILSMSFAQCGGGYGMMHPTGGMGMGYGIFGFIFLIFAFFLFSVIFWAVYIWLVKGREKKSLQLLLRK